MMNEHGKSDSPIVPAISPNKAVAEEAVEERGLTKGNAIQPNTPRTQSRLEGAPSALDLVREAARKDKRARFTALLHHVRVDQLLQAFLDTRKDAAAGWMGRRLRAGWFEDREDAKRFLAELQSRLRKFSLELHPGKTRLIRFGRFARRDSRRLDGKRKPETFNFLGFTHACSVTLAGKFMVLSTTIRKRFTAKIRHIGTELRKRVACP